MPLRSQTALRSGVAGSLWLAAVQWRGEGRGDVAGEWPDERRVAGGEEGAAGWAGQQHRRESDWSVVSLHANHRDEGATVTQCDCTLAMALPQC